MTCFYRPETGLRARGGWPLPHFAGSCGRPNCRKCRYCRRGSWARSTRVLPRQRTGYIKRVSAEPTRPAPRTKACFYRPGTGLKSLRLNSPELIGSAAGGSTVASAATVAGVMSATPRGTCSAGYAREVVLETGEGGADEARPADGALFLQAGNRAQHRVDWPFQSFAGEPSATELAHVSRPSP
jgi:hypothetical protein